MKVRNIRTLHGGFCLAWITPFPYLETSTLVGRGIVEYGGVPLTAFIFHRPEGVYIMGVDSIGVLCLCRAMEQKQDYRHEELVLLYVRAR